jgi:hypothetical protein
MQPPFRTHAEPSVNRRNLEFRQAFAKNQKKKRAIQPAPDMLPKAHRPLPEGNLVGAVLGRRPSD